MSRKKRRSGLFDLDRVKEKIEEENVCFNRVKTNARLVFVQHYLMNKNVGRLTKTLTAIPIFKKMWYPIGIQVK